MACSHVVPTLEALQPGHYTIVYRPGLNLREREELRGFGYAVYRQPDALTPDNEFRIYSVDGVAGVEDGILDDLEHIHPADIHWDTTFLKQGSLYVAREFLKAELGDVNNFRASGQGWGFLSVARNVYEVHEYYQQHVGNPN